jgi:hypothetical protein
VSAKKKSWGVVLGILAVYGLAAGLRLARPKPKVSKEGPVLPPGALQIPISTSPAASAQTGFTNEDQHAFLEKEARRLGIKSSSKPSVDVDPLRRRKRMASLLRTLIQARAQLGGPAPADPIPVSQEAVESVPILAKPADSDGKPVSPPAP